MSLIDGMQAWCLIFDTVFDILIDKVAICLTRLHLRGTFGRDSVGDRRMQWMASTERTKPSEACSGGNWQTLPYLRNRYLRKPTQCSIIDSTVGSTMMLKDGAHTFSVANSSHFPTAVIDAQADLLQMAIQHNPSVQEMKPAVDLESLVMSVPELHLDQVERTGEHPVRVFDGEANLPDSANRMVIIPVSSAFGTLSRPTGTGMRRTLDVWAG